MHSGKGSAPGSTGWLAIIESNEFMAPAAPGRPIRFDLLVAMAELCKVTQLLLNMSFSLRRGKAHDNTQQVYSRRNLKFMHKRPCPWNLALKESRALAWRVGFLRKA